MVELLLDDYIPRIWVVCIIGFITLLSDKVYFISSLIPRVSIVASFAVVIVIVKVSLRSSPRVLLELFRHTVLLEMSYFIASPASDIDASSWPCDRVLLFLLLA